MILALTIGVLLFNAGVGAVRDEAGNEIQKDDNSKRMMPRNEVVNGTELGEDQESVFDMQLPDGMHFCSLFKGCDLLGDKTDYEKRYPYILVVGAGSAGLMAALEAESGGAKVALVEKRSAGNFIRNNVLALDPMVMNKLQKIGVADKLFTRINDLPKYNNTDEWKQACVKDPHKFSEVSEITQDQVKCSDYEGATDWGYGFIRTKCLEQKLFDAVQNKKIPIASNTEFVGMAIDEDQVSLGKNKNSELKGKKIYYAVLRSAGRSPFGDKNNEVLIKVDAIVMAVGSGVINQKNQEFRKWYFVKKTCTTENLKDKSTDDCPQWLINAYENQQAMQDKALSFGKPWPSESLEASDMTILYKKVLNHFASATGTFGNQLFFYHTLDSAETVISGTPKGWEGLPQRALGLDRIALLVGIRDHDNQVCKNWLRKALHEQEHKWQELRTRGFVNTAYEEAVYDDVKKILRADTDFTKKFVWNLEYHSTQKQSYAMTGLFIPLKSSNLNWDEVNKNHVWNPGAEGPDPLFTELSNDVRGANWLGREERLQQIRLFPNRCLVYLTLGLSNNKAKELMTSSYGSPPEVCEQSRKAKCEKIALDAGGCDRQTSAQAESNCDFLDNWVNLEFAPSCDELKNKSEAQDCKSQVKTNQIAFLERAAADSGLRADSVLVPSTIGRAKSWHTFFSINLFNLGPAPWTGEPLFLLGDAGHAPNFLSGCGVVGGQDDTAAVGHYVRWMQNPTGADGWPTPEQARQCTADMLKVIQRLVYERSCKYSECHEHNNLGMVPGMQAQTIMGDARYQRMNTHELATFLSATCSEFMDAIDNQQTQTQS